MAMPKKIDPDAQYRVTLTEPVTVGRRVLKPRLEHTVSGKILEQIKDTVIDVFKAAD